MFELSDEVHLKVLQMSMRHFSNNRFPHQEVKIHGLHDTQA